MRKDDETASGSLYCFLYPVLKTWGRDWKSIECSMSPWCPLENCEMSMLVNFDVGILRVFLFWKGQRHHQENKFISSSFVNTLSLLALLVVSEVLNYQIHKDKQGSHVKYCSEIFMKA